jgi:hypothetical protein
MSAMTWYHLRAPAARQGRRFIVAYTAAMFGLTFAMYLSSAMMLEAAMIEAPADTPEASGTLICGPWSITNTVVSTLQFLLSDALLVKMPNARSSVPQLTIRHRCTGHIFCSEIRRRS